MKTYKFLVCILLLCTVNSCGKAPVSQFKHNYPTLRDKSGNVIRALPIAIGKSYQSISVVEDLNMWKQIKELGYNGVRLCWVDPWFAVRKYDHRTVDEALETMDVCVRNARSEGLNIIIDYHNVGEYEDNTAFEGYKGGFGMMHEFWTKVAPKYKDVENLYYELNNEQAFSTEKYLEPEFMSNMKQIYEQVRADAPDKEVIMFSFNQIGIDMLKVIKAYTWLDWNKTVVGWHFYGGSEDDAEKVFAGEKNLRDLLRSGYRTICTEWDYPGKAVYIKPFYGCAVNAEMLEEFGISWVDWRGWNDVTFDACKTYLLPDAKEKGYWWGNN